FPENGATWAAKLRRWPGFRHSRAKGRPPPRRHSTAERWVPVHAAPGDRVAAGPQQLDGSPAGVGAVDESSGETSCITARRPPTSQAQFVQFTEAVSTRRTTLLFFILTLIPFRSPHRAASLAYWPQ